MAWIVLHRIKAETAENRVYVNTANISAMLPHSDGGAWVFVSGARTFEVEENVEEILAHG